MTKLFVIYKIENNWVHVHLVIMHSVQIDLRGKTKQKNAEMTDFCITKCPWQPIDITHWEAWEENISFKCKYMAFANCTGILITGGTIFFRLVFWGEKKDDYIKKSLISFLK